MALVQDVSRPLDLRQHKKMQRSVLNSKRLETVTYHPRIFAH